MTHTLTKSALIALVGLALVSFLGCIDFTIVNTALPAIQTSLGVSVSQLEWVITSFMLALTALMVVKGRLADIYGRRRLLYIGMLLFAASSLAAGLATNLTWLIIARLLQGAAVAILYTVPIAMIPSIFPPEERGFGTGILVAVNGFGLAIGPIIGGFLVSGLSWHWIFLVNLPIVLLSFLLLIPTLPESKSHDYGTKIDWLGLLLLIISAPALVFATAQGSSLGWHNPLIIALFAVAAIGLLLFYYIEQRSSSPIIQFSLFANSSFIRGIIANFALAFFYTVAFFLIPLYLGHIMHMGAAKIGLMLLPVTLMVAFLSPVTGKYVDKHGAKGLLLFGFMLFLVSALMQSFFNANSSLIFIIIAFLLFGTGWACILNPSIASSLGSVPESVSGVAMGTLGTLHNFGGAFGLAVGSLVYQNAAQSSQTQAGNTLAHFSDHAYSMTMLLLVAVSLIALILVTLLPEHKPKLSV